MAGAASGASNIFGFPTLAVAARVFAVVLCFTAVAAALSSPASAQEDDWEKSMIAATKALLGPNHLDVATALNNLAGLYDLQDRWDDAEAGFLRSLEIRRKVLGERHPDVATSLYYLSRMYRSAGRLDEAGIYLERSLAIWERILGPAHVTVASNLYDLAQVYRAQGRFDEAERIEGRIRAIWAYRAQQPAN